MQNVPVFILAGGLGTRLSEETASRPKPMIEIGGIPILVHIMRRYYAYGFNDFVICAGYKSWEIKNFFVNYGFRQSHLVIDHRKDPSSAPKSLDTDQNQEHWRVRVIDTGESSMTGARVARAFDAIADTEKFENFALTYGDGVCDLDLTKEWNYHGSHGKIGTVLGVHPLARFGELDLDSTGRVKTFLEKPQSRQGVINGGFFFFKREFRKYLKTDAECILERQPLSDLAQDSQLMVHKHDGFWQPMDTLRDKMALEELWAEGKAPWLKR
jgi:glucose-1-phosphate cytidylyltransferase